MPADGKEPPKYPKLTELEKGRVLDELKSMLDEGIIQQPDSPDSADPPSSEPAPEPESAEPPPSTSTRREEDGEGLISLYLARKKRERELGRPIPPSEREFGLLCLADNEDVMELYRLRKAREREAPAEPAPPSASTTPPSEEEFKRQALADNEDAVAIANRIRREQRGLQPATPPSDSGWTEQQKRDILADNEDAMELVWKRLAAREKEAQPEPHPQPSPTSQPSDSDGLLYRAQAQDNGDVLDGMAAELRRRKARERAKGQDNEDVAQRFQARLKDLGLAGPPAEA